MKKTLVPLTLILFFLVSLTSCEGSRDTRAYRKQQDKGVWHKWSKDECPQAYREP